MSMWVIVCNSGIMSLTFDSLTTCLPRSSGKASMRYRLFGKEAPRSLAMKAIQSHNAKVMAENREGLAIQK